MYGREGERLSFSPQPFMITSGRRKAPEKAGVNSKRKIGCGSRYAAALQVHGADDLQP